jgi:hypothetical protein
MATVEEVRELIEAGRKTDLRDYADRYPKYNATTFYFLCSLLSARKPEDFSQSVDLRNHIIEELKENGIPVKLGFNPEGWFGSSWTRDEKCLKHKTPFDSKYREVLERSAKSP